MSNNVLNIYCMDRIIKYGIGGSVIEIENFLTSMYNVSKDAREIIDYHLGKEVWEKINYIDCIKNKCNFTLKCIMKNREIFKYIRHIYNKENINELICAVMFENIEIIDYFVDKINEVDKYGYTALLYAISNNYYNIVKKLLLIENVDIHIKSKDGKNALMYACIGSSVVVSCVDGVVDGVEIMRLLLNKGADVNTIIKCDISFLMYNIECENIEIIKMILDNDKLNINYVDKNGNTALHYAVKNGNLDIIKLLMSNKRLEYERRNMYGETVLFVATKYCSSKVVELLLSYNIFDICASIESSNYMHNIHNINTNPLINAINMNKYDIVDMMLKNTKDFTYTTIYVNAIKSNKKVLMEIIDRTKYIENINHYVSLALYMIYDGKNYIESIEILLKNRMIDVNDIYDDSGRTLLMKAISMNSYNMVKILVNNGADVRAVDLNKKSVKNYVDNCKSERIKILFMNILV